MRPPRIIIAAAFFVSAVFITFLSLRSSHPPHTIRSSATSRSSGIQSFFSFRAPFSLFPPNAVITLTHENSTAFLARPAAFGPSLPQEGLKGQVWIGSGFGDDASAEGELGCTDVLNWVEGSAKSGAATSPGVKSVDAKSATTSAKFRGRRSVDTDGPFVDRTAAPSEHLPAKKVGLDRFVDDGTDDYLHQPLSEVSVSKLGPLDSESLHADIQSLQEGAEIAGKVVLLSRGGCGFLEKVKWAQRRGAIALIVGDDTKGGQLIQMYARGDTSNVTIPSIFTSRTTAHLLSTLIGVGNFMEDYVDENGNPGVRMHHPTGIKKKISSPTFTASTTPTRPTSTTRATSRVTHKKKPALVESKATPASTERPGWFRSIFFGTGKSGSKTGSSRPPSSGQLDWVLVDDWKDDDSSGSKKISAPKTIVSTDRKGGAQKKKGGDDFVIGVQDWRDPDLVGTSSGKDSDAARFAKSDKTNSKKAGKKHIGGALQEIPEWSPSPRGGSITPGSGEYGGKTSREDAAHVKEDLKPSHDATGKSKGGLLNAIFGDDEEDVEFLPSTSAQISNQETLSEEEDGDEEYEGLWVTLTPTSGASPFLDTLLVLVVSPLVTLTVVYALLLMRSRIRRRRWRAPKSVVERLPVRTYQTIIPSGTQTPRLPSPTSSSATTPLLQQSPPRPRPRSRTTSGIPESSDPDRVSSQPRQMPPSSSRSPRPEHEKNASMSSEWKKHMGKQMECVICLEEYVDGVSRVMSLPCGHEFHVDCITPWLTTRRRTCPICKGDVVRSLARGSPSSPRHEAYRDDSDDDDSAQVQAAESRNDSSSSALPIPSTFYDESDGDLEQGQSSSNPTRPRITNRSASWRSIIASSLGSSRSHGPPTEGRDR